MRPPSSVDEGSDRRHRRWTTAAHGSREEAENCPEVRRIPGVSGRRPGVSSACLLQRVRRVVRASSRAGPACRSHVLTSGSGVSLARPLGGRRVARGTGVSAPVTESRRVARDGLGTSREARTRRPPQPELWGSRRRDTWPAGGSAGEAGALSSGRGRPSSGRTRRRPRGPPPAPDPRGHQVRARRPSPARRPTPDPPPARDPPRGRAR